MMEKITGKDILIDTNPLVYCWDGKFGLGAKKLLRELKDNKNNLATSMVNCFELMKNSQDGNMSDYYLKLIEYIHNISISPDILSNASVLYKIYRDKFGTDDKKCMKDGIDLIIGGTVLANKMLSY